MQPSIARIKASDGTGNASVATVQNVRSIGASTIIVDTVQGIPTTFYGSMGTPHTFNDPITGEEITVISEATCVDFAGHVDGSDIEIDEIAPGYSDLGSQVGDIVIIKSTTQWADNVAAVIESMAVNPVGMIAPFAGSSAPDNWLLCDGSAISRATYSNLFDVIGTVYGTGDGSTTFNVPDLRARSPIGVGAGTFAFTFASTDVNTGTDQITVSSNEELITGRKIRLTTTGTLPTGLSLATDYYIIKIDSTHIKFATTLANAVAGTAIDLTATGSGTNTATGTMSTRILGQKGGEETHASTISETPAHVHDYPGTFNVGTGAGGTAVVLNTTTPVPTSSVGGSTAHNNMQPFLALNYIIKT